MIFFDFRILGSQETSNWPNIENLPHYFSDLTKPGKNQLKSIVSSLKKFWFN